MENKTKEYTYRGTIDGDFVIYKGAAVMCQTHTKELVIEIITACNEHKELKEIINTQKKTIQLEHQENTQLQAKNRALTEALEEIKECIQPPGVPNLTWIINRIEQAHKDGAFK